MFHDCRRLVIGHHDLAHLRLEFFGGLLDLRLRGFRHRERERGHVAGFAPFGFQCLLRELQTLLLELEHHLTLALLHRGKTILRRFPEPAFVLAHERHLFHKLKACLQALLGYGRKNLRREFRHVVANIHHLENRVDRTVVPVAKELVTVRVHNRLRVLVQAHHGIERRFAHLGSLPLVKIDHRLEIPRLVPLEPDNVYKALAHVVGHALALHHVVEIAAGIRESQQVAELGTRKRRLRRLTALLVFGQELAELGKLENVYEGIHDIKYT